MFEDRKPGSCSLNSPYSIDVTDSWPDGSLKKTFACDLSVPVEAYPSIRKLYSPVDTSANLFIVSGSYHLSRGRRIPVTAALATRISVTARFYPKGRLGSGRLQNRPEISNLIHRPTVIFQVRRTQSSHVDRSEVLVKHPDLFGESFGIHGWYRNYLRRTGRIGAAGFNRHRLYPAVFWARLLA